MLFSINRFVGDGATAQFEINFSGGYIDPTHVKAFSTHPTTLAETPLTVTFIGPSTVRVAPVPPLGHGVEIYRDTPKNVPLVDYTDGAIVSAKNLDKTAQQTVFATAEVYDRLIETTEVSDAASADAATARATANSAAAAAASAVSDAAEALAGVTGATAAAIAATAAADAANTAATTATAAADAATTTAASALATANAAEATANAIAATANTALTTANAAAADAASALSTATGIEATANTALSGAQAATLTANGAANDIAAHLSDGVGAHAASAISNIPAGGVAATTVQAAINELDSEKAPAASPSFTGTVDIAGNITLSGTGRRITGDFSNATPGNRVVIQTSAVNSATAVRVAPSGTGTTSSVQVSNSSGNVDWSFCAVSCTATEAQISSSAAGGAGFLPLTFYTGGAERLRIAENGKIAVNYTGTAQAYFTAYGGAASALTDYSAEFVTSSGTSNAGRVVFSQNTTVGLALSMNSTASFGSANAQFQWITRSTGAVDNTPLTISGTGAITFGTGSAAPYNNTTATAANLVIAANGAVLQRSTSSRRYKTDITDSPHGLADVLKLRSVLYRGINDGAKVFGGMIAEEVHDAGLHEFVQYDELGRPDALHYSHMVSLAFKAIGEQQALLVGLQERINQLEASLASRV